MFSFRAGEPVSAIGGSATAPAQIGVMCPKMGLGSFGISGVQRNQRQPREEPAQLSASESKLWRPRYPPTLRIIPRCALKEV